MPVDLNADDIIRLAHTIVIAASPPYPHRGLDTSEEDSEQQAWDWIHALDYDDPHISISITPALSDDGQKKGVEVWIADNEEEEDQAKTLFIGYELWGSDKDPTTTIGDITVDIFLPGSWIDHLADVAQRAIMITEARPPTSNKE